MTDDSHSAYQFGPFRLDLREQRLLRAGVIVPLSPKVFDLLRVLVENHGHLVEKDVLLTTVWPGTFVEEGALNRNVSLLRKALGEDSNGQKYIETVPKRGYRFIAEVTRPSGANPSADEARPNTTERSARHRLVRTAALIAAVLVPAAGWLTLHRSARGAEGQRGTLHPLHRQVTFTGQEGAPTLSPDGNRIAYVSHEKSEKKLVVQELADGRPLEIFAAPEIGYVRWSPDGSELLAWIRGAGRDGVHILPQLGGTPRVVAPGQFVGCWSPDGETVAIAPYIVGQIVLFDRHGVERRKLTLSGNPWSIWDIDWSAASDRLLFVSSDQQGLYTIWTIRPDGSEQKKIFSARTEIPSARWTPNGDGFYYFQRVNQTASLQRMSLANSAGGGDASATVVLSGLEADRSFALSADATRLVYARAPFYSNLRVLDIAGGQPIELTRGTSLIERPRVSPDGTSLVFNVGHEPLTNLFTMPIEGGVPKQLTHLAAMNVGGVWSPDGTQLAFASTHGGRARIWTVAAGGGTPQPLSTGDLSDNLDAVWAPGPRVLYQQAGNRNYYEIDPQTAAEQFLVRDGSPGWMFAPVYSPDATKIAVMWNRSPNRGIWVLDLGARHRPATFLYRSSAPYTVRPIGWSSDGAWIYVVEGKPGSFRGATSYVGETITEARILRVAAGGTAVEAVATTGTDEIGSVTMTPDARRFVYPVFSSRSDIWIVDGFDVTLRARAR